MSTTQSLPAWKEEVNAKLNEHRSRRKLAPDEQSRLAELEPSFATRSRERAASSIAARVAERYSKAPSYRDMLEEEAAKTPARLITRETEQETSAQTAKPMQRAEQNEPEPTLFENDPVQVASEAPASVEPRGRLNRWAEFEPVAEPEAPPTPEPEIVAHIAAVETAPAPTEPLAETELLNLLPAAEEESTAPFEIIAEEPALPALVQESPEEAATRLFLEELAATPIEPAEPLPARIIEFPRELVAPRKARPRHEQGPDYSAEEEQSQLRIFEAEPDTVTDTASAVETQVQPETKVHTESTPAAPTWNAIRLDEEPQSQPAGFFDDFAVTAEQSSLLLDPPIYTARLEDRLMAGIVDACIVGAGFLMFVAAFVTYTSHLPMGKIGLMAGGATLLGLFLIYQFLFLNYAEATPGMRYAKIALCTFDDDNPTREAKRARIGAILLSALPLGLGFLWSFFDEDRLGWHDRITRTYQRSYREN